MAGNDIPAEDVEKYQQYTAYLFIDIKATFIVIYAYISVINLISTTANNEANHDTESPLLFNLTSRPEHTNVNVSSIDDATLWSCREYSPTSSYYVILYCMLLTTFSIILFFSFFSKLLALLNINKSDSLTDLWHIAVTKQLQEELKKNYYRNNEDTAKNRAKYYYNLLSKNITRSVYDEIKILPAVRRRKLIPYFSLIGLTSAMTFSALSYDLHLVSCIHGIPEDSIKYDSATQTVELRFTDCAIIFQQTSVFLAIFSFYAVIAFALIFRLETKHIIKIMKENLRKR